MKALNVYRLTSTGRGCYAVQQLVERWFGPRWRTLNYTNDPDRFEGYVRDNERAQEAAMRAEKFEPLYLVPDPIEETKEPT